MCTGENSIDGSVEGADTVLSYLDGQTVDFLYDDVRSDNLLPAAIPFDCMFPFVPFDFEYCGKRIGCGYL